MHGTGEATRRAGVRAQRQGKARGPRVLRPCVPTQESCEERQEASRRTRCGDQRGTSSASQRVLAGARLLRAAAALCWQRAGVAGPRCHAHVQFTRPVHTSSSRVQCTRPVHTSSAHVQRSRPAHASSAHVQHTRPAHTSSTRVQRSRPAHASSAHVQHTRPALTSSTRVQRTRLAHASSAHVQHMRPAHTSSSRVQRSHPAHTSSAHQLPHGIAHLCDTPACEGPVPVGAQ
ncbi:variant surface antigen E-like [Ochotona curzoniae]|uniref:variant surface antigen E-like n=1 Tax=Ochotona curzoniae TaxID=130825 RepID=UPI001B34A51A|nr:variant surface antigen E-like [Ochotona curzoniae]